jgi:cold shock protein
VEKGIVKWYNEIKGYGFILSKEGKEIFVHKSGLYSSFLGLYQDEEVEYMIKNGPNGPQAINVKTLK